MRTDDLLFFEARQFEEPTKTHVAPLGLGHVSENSEDRVFGHRESWPTVVGRPAYRGQHRCERSITPIRRRGRKAVVWSHCGPVGQVELTYASGWRRVGPPRPPRRRHSRCKCVWRRGRMGQPGDRTRERIACRRLRVLRDLRALRGFIEGCRTSSTWPRRSSRPAWRSRPARCRSAPSSWWWAAGLSRAVSISRSGPLTRQRMPRCRRSGGPPPPPATTGSQTPSCT